MRKPTYLSSGKSRERIVIYMKYDVVIIGAGPGGIFSAYELMKQNKNLKIAVFEEGNPLDKRHCPIDGNKVKTCIKCKTCAIMSVLAYRVKKASGWTILRQKLVIHITW